MANSGLLKISMEYSLSNSDEELINKIIGDELSKKEKIELLVKLDDERMKLILSKMGFTQEFLKTI